MERLETLVRDTLVAHETHAPDAGGLLRAVRGGVVRRRRLRTGAVCAALILVAVAGVLVAGVLPGPAGLREFSGHNRPVPLGGPTTRPPAPPAAVVDAAEGLSRAFAPHDPAPVVWVATTLDAWYALEGDPPATHDGPAYVVEIRLAAPTSCLYCHGPAPVTGRYGITVIDVGGGDGGEGVVTNVDYPLDQLGTVLVVGTGY